MTRHLSDNLPPPLSSESRPEGHPYDGHRTNKTAVRQKENLNQKILYQPNRCRQNKNQNLLSKSTCHLHRCTPVRKTEKTEKSFDFFAKRG